ncbi:glycosyltransferase [Trinickia caryophylli]|nr:glycosyltransferase [Trinickia caryophylli]PMS08947.1 glycosyltransferase [Trinickia caryophylli]TRX20252.1 glycosyltransferase [Trinickia caryophylli]WQE13750.1 glycosyltransferase [Trinickia caryophylli]
MSSQAADHEGMPNRPIRVLFHINDFGRGGTETALIAWLNALDRRSFAPSVAVTYPTDDLDLWRAHALPADVPVHVLASATWMHRLHQRQRGKKLGRLAKVAHKISTHGAIRPLAARRFLRLAREHDLVCDFDLSLRHIAGRAGVPWIGFSHFSLAARLGNKPPSYIARRIRQFTRYGAIAVLTPDMLREAGQLFKDAPVRAHELPNVIEIDAIRRRAAESTPSARSPFIVSVARLDEGQKDHRTLLRAFAKARAQRPGIGDLLLIGDGPDREPLAQLARELGIEPAVRFLGFCANPFPYMRAAEMLVLSSRYEGFGMVLGEAMALGTPVISADCPTGPRDLLDGGRAGLLVAPGDADAMADAMLRLATDEALRESLRRNAAAKVRTFSPENANRRMLALWHLFSSKHEK